jgi:hypothetical protein
VRAWHFCFTLPSALFSEKIWPAMGIIFPEKITNTHFLAVASWDLRNEDLANQQAHPALNRNETQFKGFGVSPHPLTVPTFYETERSRFLIASTVKTRTETASDSNMISAHDVRRAW